MTRVAAVGSGGDGVILAPGGKIFVPYTLDGEEITLKPPGLIAASPVRQVPPCPHHGNFGLAGCGGCRMQHMADDAYRLWKTGLIREALRHAGVSHPPLDPICVSPPFSRRRASLTAERRGGRLLIGFTQRGTHTIVDIHTCLILRPELFALVAPLRRLPLLRERERADFVVASIGNDIDLLIERRRELDLEEREALAAFAVEHSLARISWRGGPRQAAEPVTHLRPFLAVFGGHSVVIPPGGFMQATAEGEAALVSVLRQALPPGRTIDLFAGSGTFTFPAAINGPVHAVEGLSAACAAIQHVGASGVTAETRNLFEDPVTDFMGYTAAVIDPPHTGADAQCRALADTGPETIIAISCNPGSFARDAATLARGGYSIERILPVDQFLWSAEVELAAILRR